MPGLCQLHRHCGASASQKPDGGSLPSESRRAMLPRGSTGGRYVCAAVRRGDAAQRWQPAVPAPRPWLRGAGQKPAATSLPKAGGKVWMCHSHPSPPPGSAGEPQVRLSWCRSDCLGHLQTPSQNWSPVPHFDTRFCAAWAVLRVHNTYRGKSPDSHPQRAPAPWGRAHAGTG